MQPIRQIPLWNGLKVKTRLRIRYSNYKAPFQEEEKALKSHSFPMYARYNDVYDKVSEDILRWRVCSRTSASTVPNVVMRTRLMRRWKNAFADVLKQRGYDLNGNMWSHGQKVPGLRGTLDVTIHLGKGLNNPYTDLLKDAQTTVAALEKLQLPPLSPQHDKRPHLMSPGSQRETWFNPGHASHPSAG